MESFNITIWEPIKESFTIVPIEDMWFEVQDLEGNAIGAIKHKNLDHPPEFSYTTLANKAILIQVDSHLLPADILNTLRRIDHLFEANISNDIISHDLSFDYRKDKISLKVLIDKNSDPDFFLTGCSDLLTKYRIFEKMNFGILTFTVSNTVSEAKAEWWNIDDSDV